MTIDRETLDRRFADWLLRIEQMHTGAHHRANPEASFTPLPRPLAGCRIGLLTTAGAYEEGQEPFDVADHAGDPSLRVLPTVAPRLRFAHSHYDTTAAQQDHNVVLPTDRLAELADEGVVGSAASVAVGMMGFNPDPLRVIQDTAPQVVEVFRNDGVDAVVLSPG
jgi:D-proline reductase (dithiol) PrdB